MAEQGSTEEEAGALTAWWPEQDWARREFERAYDQDRRQVTDQWQASSAPYQWLSEKILERFASVGEALRERARALLASRVEVSPEALATYLLQSLEDAADAKLR